ncbi:hypothetical protein ADICEAN_01170 [Cesiribacter andamanensis AMV16]|uniref:Uncharacterized protein n=1 Tax=Cesiribacter andamanensis AMV16 TaxID=1279009 RepID=M7NZ66_9BACT|nr:hypothetical protein ADICEAN_01170 [Cesiribacter andamanensis AMV16]
MYAQGGLVAQQKLIRQRREAGGQDHRTAFCFGRQAVVLGNGIKLALIDSIAQVLQLGPGLVIMGDLDIAKGHRSMIALQAKGSAGPFLLAEGAPGGAAQLQVFMQQHPIHLHTQQPGVFGFGTAGIEAGCLIGDLQFLPQAWSLAYILPGGIAFVSPLAFGLTLVPAFVDASVICKGRGSMAPAVFQLHLIESLQVNAGVGSFGHHVF